MGKVEVIKIQPLLPLMEPQQQEVVLMVLLVEYNLLSMVEMEALVEELEVVMEQITM